MSTIAEKQTELIELYNGLDDPIMQYEFLLQLAGEVPVPEADGKSEGTKIHNCQTDSWFIMKQAKVLSIFVYLLDGRTPEEILDTPLDFMEKTTIREQLSISRFSVLSKLPDTIYQFCKIQKSHK